MWREPVSRRHADMFALRSFSDLATFSFCHGEFRMLVQDSGWIAAKLIIRCPYLGNPARPSLHNAIDPYSHWNSAGGHQDGTADPTVAVDTKHFDGGVFIGTAPRDDRASL